MRSICSGFLLFAFAALAWSDTANTVSVSSVTKQAPLEGGVLNVYVAEGTYDTAVANPTVWLTSFQVWTRYEYFEETMAGDGIEASYGSGKSWSLNLGVLCPGVYKFRMSLLSPSAILATTWTIFRVGTDGTVTIIVDETGIVGDGKEG